MADSGELPEDEQEMSEAEIGSDEEEERESSAEEGSDGEEDEEGSEDESPSALRRPRTKHKLFVAPPPRTLPQRTTRGARMGAVAAEEGDEEFWNQEFFAEEANDERYETESEPEDRFDVDFNESEDDGDEDEEAAEAEAEAKSKEPKKKVLKPPGYKKPPLLKARPKPAPGGGEESGGKGKGKQRRSSIGPEDFAVERRMVRESTRLKVEEGELERKMAEKYKPRRTPQRSSTYRPLTQAELLAEAAKTEIENTKSLQMLVAIEEETKKRAQVQKKRYAGPMVRWKSRRVGEVEMSTLEVRNMAMPDEMQAQVAPPPAPRLLCSITGQPARYREPLTGLPYASLVAYQELKKRQDAGLIGRLPPGAASQPGYGQQQAAAAPGLPLHQSTRQMTVQQLPMAAQFVQLQQRSLYQPQVLMQQQSIAQASPAAGGGGGFT